MVVLIQLLCAATADTGDVDVHGPPAAGATVDPAAPLRGPSPLGPEPLVVGVSFEHAVDPLILHVREVGPSTEELLGTVSLVHVQAAGAWRRLGVAVDLPAGAVTSTLGDGFVTGDTLVALPVAIVPRSLSVAPGMRLPTGTGGRYVGDPGPGWEVVVAAAGHAGPLRAGVHVAPEWRTRTDPLLSDPLELRGGVAIGVLASDGVGVHGEVVTSAVLAGLGTEASLGVRARRGAIGAHAAAGTALVPGPGAGRLRVVAGVAFQPGARAEPEIVPVQPHLVVVAPPPEDPGAEVRVTVRDVRGEVVPAEVALEREAERVALAASPEGVWSATVARGTWDLVVSAEGLGAQVREVDVDGPQEVEAVLLPVAGEARLEVTVADLDGRDVKAARLLVDGFPVGSVGSGGELALAGLAAGPHALAVDANDFRRAERDADLAAGAARVAVTLAPVPGTVRVRTRTPEGPVEDAWVAFDGPVRRSAVAVGASGERTIVLPPGRWLAVVTSEGHGAQAREVIVTAEDLDEALVDVVFLPIDDEGGELGVRVVDPDGAPVAGAEVRVRGVVVGVTSTGGALALRDLPPGDADLEVGAPRMGAARRVVRLDRTAREEVVLLPWEPGATRLVVHHDEGPVGDAVVAGTGPAPFAPLPVPPDGVAFATLAPGTWTFTATSPLHGLLTRRVATATPGHLTDVRFRLAAPEEGPALTALALTVRDAEGGPIAGAAVAIDREPRGQTVAGRLEIPGLVPGARTLGVEAPGHAPHQAPLALSPGPQEHAVALPWRHAVRVRVETPAGPPADAIVRLLSGGSSSPPVAMDAGGVVVPAAPGRWQVVVSSVEHGLGTATVEVREDAALVDAVVRIERSGATDLLVLVQDPLGRPVAEATVDCAGCPTSSPGSGGAVLLPGLQPGPTPLQVSAPNHRDRTVEADVGPGDEQRVVRLVPVPGRLEVRAVDAAGGPVDAEVRFAGPYEVEPAALGPDGVGAFELPPGSWEVSVRAEGYGARKQAVVVGAAPATLELVLRPARVEVAARQVVIEETVRFDLGEAVLRPESAALLEEVASTLAAWPDLVRVEVQGHTDATGDLVFNQALSQARAEAVRSALVALGVAPDRLVARGYGPTRPVAPNADEDGRGRNRRVQFDIVERAPE